MIDVQDRYRQVSKGFDGAVQAVAADKWETQSPCEQWKARDVARTVGANERLDEDSVRHAYEALKPMDAMIRQPNVFGPKLEPPPGADLQTEFLYFLGRRA